jgi:hypothetical protein
VKLLVHSLPPFAPPSHLVVFGAKHTALGSKGCCVARKRKWKSHSMKRTNLLVIHAFAVQRPNESNPLGFCCDIVKPVFPTRSYHDGSRVPFVSLLT